ncbi:MAG: DUF2007 domain-containing protein [Acidimicrobiia bacterium]|nr:MAG: DUF2007 domain-containing protein [Acidimicrobiia bacterium]
MTESTGYVKVASLPDASTGRLAAALLDSAGIRSRLHGEAMGPYVMNLGAWAVTDLWVAEPQADEARAILAEAELGEITD